MPLFKFTAEFLVRSNSKEEAEQTVKEEIGIESYENHFLLEKIEDKGQEADLELVKV